MERSTTAGQQGDTSWQWHIEGQRRSDGSKRSSVGTRHSSCEWMGSGVGAEGHGNREVETEKGQQLHRHPSSLLASMMLVQP